MIDRDLAELYGVFLKEKSQSIIVDLKIFITRWLVGVYDKWYFLCFVAKSIIKVS